MIYAGAFGSAQAERLLWRAGFGPRRGEAAQFAKLGLRGAVRKLTRPDADVLSGPAPHDDKGLPLAPIDAFGHDHLWWLDRMVRTSTPLVERMTLVWHDWFATSNQGVASQQLMLDQNGVFRNYALASFGELLLAVTKDPAMLLWLNGVQNAKGRPNENYARELMELFTLGADRGAYTEADVREQARALTGWRGGVAKGVVAPFTYDDRYHDGGTKTIFSKSGTFDWQDSVKLCLTHPLHASFFVTKLWSYFVPTPPDRATVSYLVGAYGGRRIRPVVEAILLHPALHAGPRMAKPPVVYTAGLLRALGRGIDTARWWQLDQSAGQRLFYPPNVAGWDDSRWLDTSTFRARWFITALAQGSAAPADAPHDPARLVERARAFWGSPTLTPESLQVLAAFAKEELRHAAAPVVETALRRLVATSPDLQTS